MSKHSQLYIAGGILVLAFTASNIALGYQVSQQRAQIQELAQHTQYDLENHKAILSDEDIMSYASQFTSGMYYMAHSLSTDSTIDQLFSVEDEPYYILFVQDSCSHCRDLEANLSLVNESELPDNLYFFDMSNRDDNSPIQFEEDADLTQATYTVAKDTFKVRGTPNMIKVDPSQNELDCFLGKKAILEELNIKE